MSPEEFQNCVAVLRYQGDRLHEAARMVLIHKYDLAHAASLYQVTVEEVRFIVWRLLDISEASQAGQGSTVRPVPQEPFCLL
jgi:hypothetical protein